MQPYLIPLRVVDWACYGRLSSGPDLGFKLHVSATVPAAVAVFDAVVPRLIEETLTFKITRDHAVLTDLNAGRDGLTQVGKFLTIYPRDNAQALGLAAWIDTVTKVLRDHE
jgi:hypothetical protein